MTLAALLFVLSAPLLAVLVALVRLTSRGPAIYSQLRVGRGGRTFLIFKLRTMSHDCERGTGPQWSVRNDPRVTRFGRFLRRSHLDELPQLWNVLRGEMSLVGPRPERPEFVADLERTIPDYRGRLRGPARDHRAGPGPAAAGREGRRRLPQGPLRPLLHRRMDAWLDLRILFGTALKVLGVPFEVTRQALALPAGEAEEQAALGPEGQGGEGGLESPSLVTLGSRG